MFTASEIRVAVLTVGKVPRDVLEDVLDIINRHRHIPLAAAKSFYRETQKCPFQHLPWSTGSLHFRFLREEDARRKTRIVDLHTQRQVSHCELHAVPATFREKPAHRPFTKLVFCHSAWVFLFLLWCVKWL